MGILCLTCRDAGTDSSPASPELTAVDVSATEVWLRVKTEEYLAGGTFILKRDGIPALTTRYSLLDTVIFMDSLLPKRTYSFTAYRFENGSLKDSSNQLSVTTLDTTSHNITWQIDTLGEGGIEYSK